VVTEEVLTGLGLTDGGRASFAFADGSTAELDPVPTSAFPDGSIVRPLLRPHEPQPVWLRRQEDLAWLTTLDRGRALYLGFHQTRSVPQGVLDRFRTLARTKKVRRVVVDARLNSGGDNTTYWPLVDAVRAAGRKAVLLVGRKTFSAAGNFAAVVDAETKARVLGEPSGGSPNQWGDSVPVELPSAGLTVHVAFQDVQAVPDDLRLAVEPDVPVALTAADFFAGRDPVLARALR
jgi:prepilin-type processing-associated H-X9-DG protein